jgi:hypothetical protein
VCAGVQIGNGQCGLCFVDSVCLNILSVTLQMVDKCYEVAIRRCHAVALQGWLVEQLFYFNKGTKLLQLFP